MSDVKLATKLINIRAIKWSPIICNNDIGDTKSINDMLEYESYDHLPSYYNKGNYLTLFYEVLSYG